MILITDGWFFKQDEFQFILIHEYQKAKGVFGKVGYDSGEVVTKRDEVGYFDSLEGMLKRLVKILCKEKVDNGTISTIKQYIDTLEHTTKELTKACKGY